MPHLCISSEGPQKDSSAVDLPTQLAGASCHGLLDSRDHLWDRTHTGLTPKEGPCHTLLPSLAIRIGWFPRRVLWACCRLQDTPSWYVPSYGWFALLGCGITHKH